MKMKNMLIGGMSLALVACISIGGTLAYLTDTTGTAQNKFQMVTNGIVLNLQETAKDGAGYDVYKAVFTEVGVEKGEKVTGSPATLTAETARDIVGFIYENIQPGASMTKEVQLSIGKKDETTVNSYVFAVVDNANSADVMTLNIATGSWKQVTKEGTRTLYAYIAKDGGATTATDSEGNTYVKEHVGSWDLNEIFTTVDVADDVDVGVEMQDVRVSGYAYQADNVTFADAKTAAMKALGFTVE